MVYFLNFREGKGEREKERSINWLPPMHTLFGIKPTAFQFLGRPSNHLNHVGQGTNAFVLMNTAFILN